MPFSKYLSVAFAGLEAASVEVEVDVKPAEKGSLIIVGLPDVAVKESKDRVLTALKNSGFSLHAMQCTVNLAPGDVKKEGPLYDLPIALGLLQAQGIIKTQAAQDYLCIGELSLSGETRPVRGILTAALHARQLKKKGILVPAANAQEAAAVPGIEVIGVESLKAATLFLQNPYSPPPSSHSLPVSETSPTVDFQEIRGQFLAKRALEIAAAGGHNALLFGPPGTGKTLLAKALGGILPPLTVEESMEVTRVHSIAGLIPEGKGLIYQRPFRSPHHTVSAVGLIGGGSHPKPGEISLAHHGVLFLDELPEFSRHALEVLRQPLENHTITIARAAASVSFPTDCLLIAAMNPCPCGYLGHPLKPCRDTPPQIDKYRNRISGPLLDRIDLHIEVPAVPYDDLNKGPAPETSAEVGSRVIKARQLQMTRSGKLNSRLSSSEITRDCSLDSECQQLARQAVDQLGVSARGYHRLLKVARTIADLDYKPRIEKSHLMEALSFRS